MKQINPIGKAGEDAVIKEMFLQGYRFLDRNFSVHNMGELDVIMEKDGDIYVVEVKSRLEKTKYTDPASSISYRKRIRMLNTTKVYICKHNLYDRNVHFLAGCVTHSRDGVIQNVELIPF
ncbi:MAG: YraN family protein [Saccharofermentans sp.]|nr:YraN family protein [Saccharofermentans sp.]